MPDEFASSAVTISSSPASAGGDLLYVESGDPAGLPVVLLHGWPESSHAWRRVMRAAGDDARLLAFDLPGIGGSAGVRTDGTAAAIAQVLREAIERLGLADPVLVGHDMGGMATYSYLRQFAPAAAVIMDTVVPGVDPWAQVLANPYVWHFAFHGIPHLPQTLVESRERAYFDYFLDALSPDPSTIPDAARQAYVEAYRAPGALAAGFDWYRGLPADAEANAAASGPSPTRLLYLRGDQETGDIDQYGAGLRAAGLHDVTTGVIPGAGHFAPEDAPAEVWYRIAQFLGLSQDG